MRFDVITLQPECVEGVRHSTLWKRAEENELLSLNMHQLRDYGHGKQKAVDDTIYGGGAGMLLRVDVLVEALEAIPKKERYKVLFASPQGKTFKPVSYTHLTLPTKA